MLNPNHIRRHNWGHQLFKNAFARHHDVIYYGRGFPGYDQKMTVPKILHGIKKGERKNIDLIITYETKWTRHFPGLENVGIPKAHVVIDYVQPRKGFSGFSQWPTVNKHLKKIKPDIIFARTMRDVNDLKQNLKMKNIFFLPFSVETRTYKDMNLRRYIDVMATFSVRKDYPMRGRIQKLIKHMPKVNAYTNRVTNQAYVKKINESKIFANSGSIHKRLTMKFTEVLACNTFLLTEEAEDMTLAGFEDGKHLVTFKNIADLKSKIKYYLKHPSDRKKIAHEGMKFVKHNHNNDVRVREFINKVQEVIS
jgi:spore maturation protein CgeB